MKVTFREHLVKNTGTIDWLCFDIQLTDKLKKMLDEGFTLELKSTKGRSLQANAYFWALVHKLAIKLRSTDEEVYRVLLTKYGVMAYVGILEEAIEDLKKEVRFIDVLGPVNLGNKTGVTVRLIIG